MKPTVAVCVVMSSLVVACTSGHAARSPITPRAGTPSVAVPVSAATLCEQALPGQRVVSWQLTTVRDVRALGGGLDRKMKPAGSAFPSATGRTPAAWCWTSQGGTHWTAYAAGPDKSAVQLVVVGGLTEIPSGPPIFH